MMRHQFWCGAVVLLSLALPRFAVAQRSWDGGNGTFVWGDPGNWNPDGDPNGTAISIGNLAAAANATTRLNNTFSINSLTITNGADVINSTDDGATSDFRLLVNGPTTISDAGSSITIYGGDPEGLDTDNLTINSGATFNLNSQTAQGSAVLQVDGGTGTGLLDLNTGAALAGNGIIQLNAAPAAATVLLDNDGTLTARSFGIVISPPASTLQITASDTDARVDLDGTGGNGVVNVGINATLDIDVAINDSFSGTMNLAAGSKLDIAGAWSIDVATVNINTTGFIMGTGGPAAHLAGGAITMTGGTIILDDIDSVVFDASITASGGVINNSGAMTFNAPATFLSGVDFNMTGGEAKLTVNSIVNIDTQDFNLDGQGLAGNITTINTGGSLDLALGAGADEDFDHTINLNGGSLSVTTLDNDWSLTSIGTINAGGGATSSINGETFDVSGAINVAAGSGLNINTITVFNGAGAVDVAGVLNMSSVTYANSGATFTGSGVFRPGTATVTAATTFNVATVDLDDGPWTLNANLTINANSIDDANDGFDTSMTIADAAALTVNITGGAPWAIDPPGSLTYNGNASVNMYLSGSDINMNGTINHNGDGRVGARLNIGSTGVININTAGEALHLGGGNDSTNPNTIAGGTIQGLGILSADGGRALHGFGLISTAVEFPSANLKADNGILTLSGAITSVRVLGTADTDGILNVTNPWNTNTTVTVDLAGGELRGATITNSGALGINGHGLVSARVLNDTRIDAEGGGGLVVETVGNNNDWDGTGAGQLNAITADLEIRDNAVFPFTGTVSASASRTVFANGFALEFEPASILSLAAGARYRSTNLTNIGGAVNVTGGTASLDISGTGVFESTSVTTLTGNLRLAGSQTNVQAGAQFSGAGALIVSQATSISPASAANFNVLVTNEGRFNVAGTTTGRVDARDFQQNSTGILDVDLAGMGINQFDRLIVNGTAQLAG
ncbi:MAG TPA: hypothetical protein VH518_13145, partial [Tepidisphaeraceae bacterium]